MTPDQLRKYKDKAKQSFRTKKDLFLYKLACERRKEFTKEEFNAFKITDNLVKEFTSNYWQQEETNLINGISIKNILISILDIEKAQAQLIKNLEQEYICSFENIFSKEDFKHLLQGDKCHYCGISIENINLLADNYKLYKKNLRGWTLEIDRKNSNYEYKPDNCVMACYWCNNAKTDEFTEAEFEEVGKTIAGIWNKRINGN